MRINIPSNPGDLIALAKAINAKHIALGAASPLNGIDGIAGFGAQVTAADTNNQQADQLYKQAETATEARDNALGPDTTTPGYVRFFVTASRDVLAAVTKAANTNWATGVLWWTPRRKPRLPPRQPRKPPKPPPKTNRRLRKSSGE